MALLILEECISCTACLDECPNHAITAGDVYVIDASHCTECVGFEPEPQCVSVCPLDCIVEDPQHTEGFSDLRAKYEALFGQPAPDIGRGLSVT
jgi:ferredoxin